MRPRLIPILLLKDGGLVKSVKFKAHRYIGDPINAVRIFNEKEVDELIFLDTDATLRGTGPDFSVIRDIAEECFMPFGYGGGVTSVEQALQLVRMGVEKIVLNTAAGRNPRLVRELAAHIGSQSVVVCVDIKRNRLGQPELRLVSGTEILPGDPINFCRQVGELGAGEIILQSIDRDGTYTGYDIDLLRRVTEAVSIPVVACGGAGEMDHFQKAMDAGASAAAAGSLFVYYGKHRAVLINYPSPVEVKELICNG